MPLYLHHIYTHVNPKFRPVITGGGQAAQPTWSHYEWRASSPVHQAQTLQVGGKQPSPPGHITSGGRAAQSTKHKHYRWGASSPAHLVTLRVEGEQPSPPSTNITGGGQAAQPTWSHYEWRASSPVHQAQTLQVGGGGGQAAHGHITSGGRAAQYYITHVKGECLLATFPIVQHALHQYSKLLLLLF